MSCNNESDEDSNIDKLTNEIENLKLEKKKEKNAAQSSSVHQLAASWINDAQKIVILTGAGVSCSAGIPDFRTPGTGLYDNLQAYNLPFAEAVFDIGFYRRNPKPFLQLAKELWPGLQHSPTLTHSFIAYLAQQKKLLRNYSQNIDGLENLAQVPDEALVECHGQFRTASCIDCKSPFERDDCKRIILETNDTPTCKSCGGYVKPDIVFFGEGLPERFGNLLEQDMEEVDLLIVMGTSLQVAPVSHIPTFVGDTCKRILINREEVGDFKTGKDDCLVLLGDCDDIVMELSSHLRWDAQIRELNEKTRVTGCVAAAAED